MHAAPVENTVDPNPLEVCRMPGGGRELLTPGYNVWIDKTRLMWIYRWKHDPKMMTRKLLRTIVGEKNLINMCARGGSKKRICVPEDIMASVESKHA